MVKKKIMCVVGTRPEFIRMAPIIKAIGEVGGLEFQLLHTGQHYTYGMNRVFFDELGIPEPTVNLEVGSSSPANQTAQIMLGTGKKLEDLKPNIVVVFGDTNSSLGAALAAVKMQIPLVHIEAGCRSFDLRMSEEINRRLIDHCADFLFPVSKNPAKILKKENVPGQIFECGDPLYDVFLVNSKKAEDRSVILKELGLGGRSFALLTFHRAENVDEKKILKNIISALRDIGGLQIIFPIHPRTEKRLEEFGLRQGFGESNIKTIPPVGYWDFLALLVKAGLVITDSGGVQKEAFFARVPCITLRKTTEWMETVELGANTLIDPESDTLQHLLLGAVKESIKYKGKLKSLENPYGDGASAQRIVEKIKSLIQ